MTLHSVSIVALLIGTSLLSVDIKADDKDAATVTLFALASEGIMIRSGEQVVLMDAFVDPHESEGDSALMTARRDLLTGNSTFSRVSLASISHSHHEHFHAPTAWTFLKNHPEATLVAELDIVQAIRDEHPSDSSVEKQLAEINTTKKEKISVTLNEIRVDFIPFLHEASNFYTEIVLGQIIHIGRKKILYLGDAEMSPENLSPFDLKKEKIDIVLIPEWLFRHKKTKTLIDKHISPDKIVVVGIPLPVVGKKAPDADRQVSRHVYILDTFMDSVKF